MTGIPPATLRVWERRYGRPRPTRTPAGQRRYGAEEVRFLRKVAEGLRAGLRPKRLLAASEEELTELLRTATRDQARGDEAERWLDAALRTAQDELFGHVREAMATRPLVDVLDGVVGPFLTAVGIAWAEGRAEVRHEHLAVAAVQDALTAMRRDLPPPTRSPLFLLATPPGEIHELGFAMTSLVLRERGFKCLDLGPDVPLGEIDAAAREADAGVVALSISLAGAGPKTQAKIKELRNRLPSHVELWIGGRGASMRRAPSDIRTFADFASFTEAIGTTTPR